MAAIGIHLSCTSACVAVHKDGWTDVAANDMGDRDTPAVVAYLKNEEVVGLAAKQSRIRNISNSVMKVKQILGRRYAVVPQPWKHPAFCEEHSPLVIKPVKALCSHWSSPHPKQRPKVGFFSALASCLFATYLQVALPNLLA
uniref:Uncharacterized protein n=1 Tax=Moschus moschiferus TaxID=68415 RepID=A0A8C6DCP7_MOSMO